MFVGTALLIGVTVYAISMPPKIDPSAYAPLLSTIAKGESNGNYNAHFGNANNNTTRFTEMSIADVLQWQSEFVDQGNASSAVGKYQIIRPTLAGLVMRLDLDTSRLFDAALQDELAITLLERRGALDYVENKISREQFAANIAKEWAALPKVTGPNPQDSYYAGDGLNSSRISIEEVYTALNRLTATL